MRHRLTMLSIVTVMAATFGGLATPAAAVTKPTNATAADLTKGEVFTAPAAEHRAKKLFFLVRVPARAVLEDGDHAPGAPTLDTLDADQYTASVGHYWLTKGSVATVTAWAIKHPPFGFSYYGGSTNGAQKTLLYAPISTKAGCCLTIYTTVSKVGKHTAISVAAFVPWQPRRVKAEHIPATTTEALLAVGSDPTQTIPSFPNTSVEVSRPALTPLISALNELTATREVPLPCPYDPNWSNATFTYGGRVVEFASPSACPYVEVMVNGRPSQTLSGNITALVAKILGVTAVPSAM